MNNINHTSAVVNEIVAVLATRVDTMDVVTAQHDPSIPNTVTVDENTTVGADVSSLSSSPPHKVASTKHNVRSRREASTHMLQSPPSQPQSQPQPQPQLPPSSDGPSTVIPVDLTSFYRSCSITPPTAHASADDFTKVAPLWPSSSSSAVGVNDTSKQLSPNAMEYGDWIDQVDTTSEAAVVSPVPRQTRHAAKRATGVTASLTTTVTAPIAPAVAVTRKRKHTPVLVAPTERDTASIAVSVVSSKTCERVDELVESIKNSTEEVRRLIMAGY